MKDFADIFIEYDEQEEDMKTNQRGNPLTFNCCIRQNKPVLDDPKELANVLRELADRIEKYPDDHRGQCRASNGEYVGKWSNK